MIWCDLDSTLVYTWTPLLGAAPIPTWLAIADVDPPLPESGFRQVAVRGLDEPCWTKLRPGALEFLAALRELAPTRLLTYSARPYALAMNRTFGLGFRPREIVARDDLRKAFRASVLAVDPAGVMVDDDDRDNYRERGTKIEYLGLDPRAVVRVAMYDRYLAAGRFSDDFRDRVPTYLARISQALKGEHPVPQPSPEPDPSFDPLEVFARLQRESRK